MEPLRIEHYSGTKVSDLTVSTQFTDEVCFRIESDPDIATLEVWLPENEIQLLIHHLLDWLQFIYKERNRQRPKP